MPLPQKIQEEREALAKRVVEDIRSGKPLMEKDPKTGKLVPKMEPDPETGRMKPAVRRLNPPLVRRYIVFNGDQIANIPPETHDITLDEKDRNAAMEAMIANSEAKVQFDQKNQNFYRVSEDCVHVMPREEFKSLGAFYGTVAHEIAHSTGAESRMNREGITNSDGFGGPIYAKEELRAEMTSLFLGQEYGVAPGKEHYENHVAYLQSWAEVIEKDPDELFRAAAEAQKMTDYIKDHMIERDLQKVQTKTDEHTIERAARTVEPVPQPGPEKAKKRDFKPIHRSITIPDKPKRKRRVAVRRTTTDKTKGISR